MRKLRIFLLLQMMSTSLTQTVHDECGGCTFLLTWRPDVVPDPAADFDQQSWKMLSRTGTCEVGCTFLDLSDKNLYHIDSTAFDGLPQVRSLNLARNKLNAVVGALAGLTGLESLDLSFNEIQTLSQSSFAGLSMLKSLALHDCGITHVENGAFEGTALVQLLLQRNRISRLERQSFRDLGALESLALQDNAIESWPSGSFGDLVILEELDLARNRIQQLPANAFDSIGSLQILRLQNNRVHTIEAYFLQGLRNLREVRLQHNRIRSLPGSCFAGASGLERIWLNDNVIEYFDASSFVGLPAVTEILLSGNRISGLSTGWLSGAAALKTLSISNNHLSALRRDQLSGMPALTTLKLGQNGLAELPAHVFANLSNLNELWLNDNNLTALDGNAFAGLSSLDFLALHRNRLAAVGADAFTDTPALTVLWAGGNDIRELDSNAFRGLDSLKRLQLHSNALADLPEEGFSELPELLELFLHDNRLTGIAASALSGLPELEVLSLHGNRISESALTEQSFDGLAQLRELWLRDNQIESLPQGLFEAVGRLRYLNLRGNRLSRLQGGMFEGLHLLEDLDLQENGMEKIDEGAWAGLEALSNLFLQENAFKELPSMAFVGLPTLQTLFLSRNGMYHISDAAWEGLEALQYLFLDENAFTELRDGGFKGLDTLRGLHLENCNISEVHNGAYIGLELLEKLWIGGNKLRRIKWWPLSRFQRLYGISINPVDLECRPSVPITVAWHLSDITHQQWQLEPCLPHGCRADRRLSDSFASGKDFRDVTRWDKDVGQLRFGMAAFETLMKSFRPDVADAFDRLHEDLGMYAPPTAEGRCWCSETLECFTARLPPPSCHDKIRNQDEEGIDCGGVCQPCPSCFDSVRNQDEDEVDCGGGCVACPPANCTVLLEDWTAHLVALGVRDMTNASGVPCPESCSDGLQNQDEAGIDCGGACAPCATCEDGVQNQDEEGVDCGGACPRSCAHCRDGAQNYDEEGVDCGGATCSACPTCSDGIRNQDEADVDCGGELCDPCVAEHCSDGVLNQGEVETDCGGDDCQPCPCLELDGAICHSMAMCARTRDAVPVPRGEAVVPAAVEQAPDSDGKFLCSCGGGILGHGYGTSGCDGKGHSVRVVYQNRSFLEREEEEELLALLGEAGCQRGAELGCDHVHYTPHEGHLGVNVLFRRTPEGQLAAHAAAHAFNSALLNASRARRGDAFPPDVDQQLGARVYAWSAATTGAPIPVPPAGMELLSVGWKAACGRSGCWQLRAAVTVGHSEEPTEAPADVFSTFYLPFAPGNDVLSYDWQYTAAVHDSFQAGNFPCRVSDYTGASSLPVEATLCCLGTSFELDSTFPHAASAGTGVLGNYRTTEAFDAFWSSKALCSADLPAEAAAVGPSRAEAIQWWAEGQRMVGMGASPGVVELRGVDALLGMYEATLQLDEGEVRRKAALLRGTVGVEYSVDFFLGWANFRFTAGSQVLDSMATQAAIHAEKTDLFTVAVHGTNDYTFLEYVNLRLVAIYQEDSDMSAQGEGASRSIRTDESNAAHYVQVTFTLGGEYEVNPNSGLVPLSSVRAGSGTFVDETELVQRCTEWADGSFEGKAVFNATLQQTCAPASAMCESPTAVPESFVVFNIPLGIDAYDAPTPPSNVFVDMVVSVVDKEARNAGTQPNDGEAPWQMKTTLAATVPVVAGGINIFCDGLTAKTDLKDVVRASIIVGTASNTAELSRLRVLEDVAATQLSNASETKVDSDSIESGLLTLVLQGNASHFDLVGNSKVTVELEDLVSVHVMENEGAGPETSVVPRILQLLASGAEDKSDEDGLRGDGYALNDAFHFTIDRSAQRAHLEPSEALLALCPISPPPPAPGNPPLETCVTRRDVRARGFPARVGGASTAIEVCAAGSAATARSCQQELVDGGGGGDSDEGGLLATVLGDSEYASELAVAYALAIDATYALNDRYVRAYWVNPGYEWTPAVTQGRPRFSLSQHVFVFALVTLDEHIATDAGAPAQPPSFGRRRVLAAGEEVLQEQGGALGAAQLGFSTSREAAISAALGAAPERVLVLDVNVALSAAQACSPPSQLQAELRLELQAHVAPAAGGGLLALQVAAVVVHAGEVDCGDQRRRRRRRASATPSADLRLLVAFGADVARPHLDLAALTALSLVNSASVSQTANRGSDISVTNSPTTFLPFPDHEDATSASGVSVVMIAAASGGVGVLLLAVAAVLHRRRQRSLPEAFSRVSSDARSVAEVLKAELSDSVSVSATMTLLDRRSNASTNESITMVAVV